jgi:pimeloyl-ACP methyl ester carboxylesterase
MMHESPRSLQAMQDVIRSFSDPREREIAEATFLPGDVAPVHSKKKHFLIFLHGMNTYAEWQEMLSESIRNRTNLEPVPLGYGNVHPFKFLLPFPYRQLRLRIVLRELRAIREINPDADISIVAHSFGTYLLSRSLQKLPNLKLRHVILCGSIVKSDFDWNALKDRFVAPIVNDIGLQDRWPALAKGWSVGYGDSGSFGFKKGLVRDRYFDLDHSGFLTKDHAKRYWLPLLIDGRIVSPRTNAKRKKPTFLENEIRRFTKWHLITIISLIAFSVYWWILRN